MVLNLAIRSSYETCILIINSFDFFVTVDYKIFNNCLAVFVMCSRKLQFINGTFRLSEYHFNIWIKPFGPQI